MNHEQARIALGRAAGWHTSSYSQGQNDCVEVNAAVTGWVGLRDSKDPYPSLLAVSRPQWHALLATLP